MKILKIRAFTSDTFFLEYDQNIQTFWVTHVRHEINKYKYRTSFSLLSEAERFFDLLVEQANKS